MLDSPRVMVVVLFQYTRLGKAAFVRVTVLRGAAVMGVARKMKRALGSPPPSRVRVPLIISGVRVP